MTRRLTTGWSLPFVLAVYAAALSWIAWQALGLNDGVFTYAQDDPYIHLSIARTLALHGVWGISPDEFAGASSSPLWTVTLAALMRLTGPVLWWPLVLNILAGAALLVFVHRQLGAELSEHARATALLIFMFVLPLPTLVFIGMEHTAHVLVVLALAAGAARRLADDASPDGLWPAGLILAALAAGLRYEGLFVVAVVGALALLRRRPLMAISLVAAAAVPVVLYAAYSVSNGSWLLPNSIMIKSGAERFGSGSGLLSILTSWIGVFSIYQRPAQLALLLGAAALTALGAGPGRSPWRVTHVLAGIFAGTELLHVCLVRLEWFYRYESYVVALGTLAIIKASFDLCASGRLSWGPSDPLVLRIAVGTVAVALCLPLAGRAALSFARTPLACSEIYRQQYQMARFLSGAYAGDSIAINDIGAVSWMSPVRILDLIGLASTEITAARRAGLVDAGFMGELAARHGVTAAVIYESHFRAVRELPPAWVKVAEWSMPSAIAVHRETVAFFAPDEARATRLREALDAYASGLPAGVTYVPEGGADRITGGMQAGSAGLRTTTGWRR